MINKPTCPKCEAALTIKSDNGLCRVVCNDCQFIGKAAMTERFALAVFYRDHGLPADRFVSLKKIEKDGGPHRLTMVWRIEKGRYPDAKKQGRKWALPIKTAEKVVEEWKRRKGMILLTKVAVRCGLKRWSLDPQASRDIVHAKKIGNKWYVSREECERLKEYYLGTVTSTRAAEMLGLNHRSSVHYLGLPHYRLGTELRFSKKMLKELLAK